MSWFGIVNPHAGRHGSPFEEVHAVSEQLGLDALFVETRSDEDVDSLVKAAVDNGYSRFIAVGGDGTAHVILNALMAGDPETRPTLAIVPEGSGTDFIRTFGHDRSLHSALERILEGNTYTIDIGRVSGSFGSRYFLNACNLGVAASSAARAAALPRWFGSARYTIAFWLALWRFRNHRVRVQVDEHGFDDDAINVVVANGQFFGGGLNIAPRSSLVDGKMDVQVFRGPRRQAFSVMPRVLMGSHLTHKGVQRFSGTNVRVDVPTDWPVEADGEIIGEGGVSIEVLPSALDFII
ncbi:MAG: YegS/Rv2252/BmrU family lipid kinase [Actinomycetota bacterium]